MHRLRCTAIPPLRVLHYNKEMRTALCALLTGILFIGAYTTVQASDTLGTIDPTNTGFYKAKLFNNSVFPEPSPEPAIPVTEEPSSISPAPSDRYVPSTPTVQQDRVIEKGKQFYNLGVKKFLQGLDTAAVVFNSRVGQISTLFITGLGILLVVFRRVIRLLLL